MDNLVKIIMSQMSHCYREKKKQPTFIDCIRGMGHLGHFLKKPLFLAL